MLDVVAHQPLKTLLRRLLLHETLLHATEVGFANSDFQKFSELDKPAATPPALWMA